MNKTDKDIETLKSVIEVQEADQPESVLKSINGLALSFRQMLSGGIDETQSPVEAMFMVAWQAAVMYWPPFGTHNSCFIDISPQWEVKDGQKHYRVDFGANVMRFTEEMAFESLACVFIEIDGHEFHEKTKQQATHDKARERVISSHADRVLRFSGSEVYNDPLGCAHQALRALEEVFLKNEKLKQRG